jgi:hypothetical protein
MIVRCPHCGTGHAVRYQPGRSPGSQRCEACGKAFAFFPALEIEAVGLPRDGARMESVPVLQVPIPLSPNAAERPAPPRSPASRDRAAAATRRMLRHTHNWAPRIGGLTVGIALIAALGLQFLIHERAALYRHPELAALSDALCRQLPCPDLRRHIPGAIQVGGLQLETQAQGWLRVDMLITNTLERPQPWPLLELTLADRFGRALAQARWEPSDYLEPTEAARMLQSREVRRLRLVIDQPADAVEGISVRPL